MPIPENVPRGTPGYMHASAIDGMWHPYADRFAGALLLCEMIGWSSAEFQAASYGDSFFAPTEMQTECDRYHVMCRTLRQLGGEQLVAVFQRCWSSKTLDQAPAFWEWARALQHEYFRKVMPSQPPSNDVLSAQVQYTVREVQRALLYAPPSLTQEARRGLQKTLQWLDPTGSAPNTPSSEVMSAPPAHVYTPSRAVDPPVLSSSESNVQTASSISSPAPNRWVVMGASLVAAMVMAGVLVFGVWSNTGRTADEDNFMAVATAAPSVTIATVVVSKDEQVGAISAGYGHSLALTKSGEVVAWGENAFGQTDVPGELRNIVAVSAGGYHSLALTRDGNVIAWGWNSKGQLDVPNGLRDVVMISAGYEHSLAVTQNGTVVAWGDNSAGQTNVPRELRNVISAVAKDNHSLAVTRNGEVRAWGRNDFGELFIPASLQDVIALDGGQDYSLALTSNSEMVTWGRSGAAGHTPKKWRNVMAIAAGFRHTLILMHSGRVMVWGDNDYGQTNVPNGLRDVTAISAGGKYSLALKSGKVIAWGSNADGQLNVPESIRSPLMDTMP
jgi:hypothetical protein